MVELVARVITLDSRKRRLGIVMSDHPDEMMVIGQHFVRESHCLLLEADIWGNSLSALPQHHRVTVSTRLAKLRAVRRLHLQVHDGRDHFGRCEFSPRQS
jgi:hypothetical protein